MNTVALTGRPTTEIELKDLSNGGNAVQFNLAVNRGFKNSAGEYVADFFSVSAFNETAKFISNHVTKGTLIGVEGRLQQRSYEDKNGVIVYVVEVIANQITLLQPKGSSESVAKAVVKDKEWANAEYKKRTDGVASAAKKAEIKKQIEQEMDSNLPF